MFRVRASVEDGCSLNDHGIGRLPHFHINSDGQVGDHSWIGLIEPKAYRYRSHVVSTKEPGIGSGWDALDVCIQRQPRIGVKRYTSLLAGAQKSNVSLVHHGTYPHLRGSTMRM